MLLIITFALLCVSQEIPFEAEEQQDGYVLLLVILSIFLVGTLIFITVFLITFRRCCPGWPCYARCDSKNDPLHLAFLALDATRSTKSDF